MIRLFNSQSEAQQLSGPQADERTALGLKLLFSGMMSKLLFSAMRSQDTFKESPSDHTRLARITVNPYPVAALEGEKSFKVDGIWVGKGDAVQFKAIARNQLASVIKLQEAEAAAGLGQDVVFPDINSFPLAQPEIQNQWERWVDKPGKDHCALDSLAGWQSGHESAVLGRVWWGSRYHTGSGDLLNELYRVKPVNRQKAEAFAALTAQTICNHCPLSTVCPHEPGFYSTTGPFGSPTVNRF